MEMDEKKDSQQTETRSQLEMSEALRKMAGEVEGKVEEESAPYNPIISVRRDFGESINPDEDASVYRGENGEAVIDDIDLRIIEDFYHDAIKPGSLLNLGAGPIHFHYLGGVEDRLTHVTAFDISEKNLDVLKEFMDHGRQGASDAKMVNESDMDVLKLALEGYEAAHKDNVRPGQEILDSLREKSKGDGPGGYDLVVGNFHDLDNIQALGERKFDNILFSYSLYANKPKEVVKLFEQAKRRLNPGGRLIIADMQGFTNEDGVGSEDEYREDAIVEKLYPDFMDYSSKSLERYLLKAGFNKGNLDLRDPVSETESRPGHEIKYLFMTADNIEAE